jgi:hypothetical protein
VGGVVGAFGFERELHPRILSEQKCSAIHINECYAWDSFLSLRIPEHRKESQGIERYFAVSWPLVSLFLLQFSVIPLIFLALPWYSLSVPCFSLHFLAVAWNPLALIPLHLPEVPGYSLASS